ESGRVPLVTDAPFHEDLDATLATLTRRLLERRTAAGHWEGALASSALSTATAVIALILASRDDSSHFDRLIAKGARWLLTHQNADGGWGDTVRSRSNISTTALVWSALSMASSREALGTREPPGFADAHLDRAEAWLYETARDSVSPPAERLEPDVLRKAILLRYGKDKTFSVPILTALALARKLGRDRTTAWRNVPQLPFELATLPHRWFHHARLPVVSYALPALVAIGQVRHHFAPTSNPVLRRVRNRVRRPTLDVLRNMQPQSGGFLEAAPLTSFVAMSLAAAGHAGHPVVQRALRFLEESARSDGSWPIDTNLATWVTTLAVSALAGAGELERIDTGHVRAWLLAQQAAREHPFTHAAPGGWAWTDLTGGVPDADDTAGALLALRSLGPPDMTVRRQAAAGVEWLLGVQNRDGGIPTFCRGWGRLPFDRSTPEISAHALQALSAWRELLDRPLQTAVLHASRRALRCIAREQRADGAWAPLWFGNEQASDEENRTYGTARVLAGLQAPLVRDEPGSIDCRRKATAWLLHAQNEDGGWGGSHGVASSIEETGVALTALSRARPDADPDRTLRAVARGAAWLVEATKQGECTSASPIGLYFARLWYFEELYPVIFAIGGLAAARNCLIDTRTM
ncbi:MAG: prenyltransferase/squalene oxidase repeat-containing protein, partial [Vicinamibacteraceae bacterium]